MITTPGFIPAVSRERERRPAAHSPIYGVGAREGKLESARPGAVRAPPGGLGHLRVLAISKGAGPHAHLARYGHWWR
eukprot:scaffold69101_cov48-Phaeocystis_antarctica.AAC.1